MELGLVILVSASVFLLGSGLTIPKTESYLVRSPKVASKIYSFPLIAKITKRFSFIRDFSQRKEVLFTPLILGIFALFFLRSFFFAVLGVIIGFTIPKAVAKFREVERRRKFSNQILDVIMTLNSCLKAGNSLLQACEVVAEELPPPASEEFSLVVKETKIGISLEESLLRLDKRMGKIEELEMLINSLLVARETGGDVIKVLNRLAVTIRDNRKLKDMVRTLTLQGRLQGIIMSILPFFFIAWVLMFNKHHFDIMFENPLGRMMLIVALVLQVIGMILIKRFSTIKI